MKRLFTCLIPMALLGMSGCVVAPYGYRHAYYERPRVVVTPAPVVVVRPYSR